MTAAKPKDPARNRQIKAIHAMARELKLAEDSYRAIVARASAGRTDSSAALSPTERLAVLDRLRALGAGRKDPTRPARYVAASPAQWRKVRALWGALGALNELFDSSEEALESFVRRQTQQDIGQLDGQALNKVIEALKNWLARVRKQAVSAAGGGGHDGG